MSEKFVVAHRRDINNVGDMASMPLQYFLKPHEYQVIDVIDLHRQNYNPTLPLILGGGGLLNNEFIGPVEESLLTEPDRRYLQELGQTRWVPANPRMQKIARNFHEGMQNLVASALEQIPVNSVPRFIWGAGHNANATGDDRIKYSPWLSEYRMVGLRDWHGTNSRYRWTPCASCMHPAFDRTYALKNDVIWFEHKKRIIKDHREESIPRFTNAGSNFEQTIELLGSANVILTNSYHGAYWGTLLQKRVIVVDAWSSQFFHLRHRPVLLNTKRQTWHDVVDEATIYPDALEVCRQANREYWQDLQTTLEQRPAKRRREPPAPVRDGSQLDLGFTP